MRAAGTSPPHRRHETKHTRSDGANQEVFARRHARECHAVRPASGNQRDSAPALVAGTGTAEADVPSAGGVGAAGCFGDWGCDRGCVP